MSMHSEDKAPLQFGYVNHRGEYGLRTVMPEYMWYGFTIQHPEPQWFLHALCLDKRGYRNFAVKDMILRQAD